MTSGRRLPRTGWHDSRKLRFLAIGIYNTAFGYACFSLLYLLAGRHVHYVVLLVNAHFLSVANAFVGHRRVTFRSSAPWLPEFLRFNVSYLGTLVFGVVALPALVKGFGLHPLLAGALITVLTVLLSYLLHRHYSFKSDANAGGRLRPDDHR